MPEKGTTNEETPRSEPLADSTGEEIGLLAATVAVSHAVEVDESGDEDGQSRRRSVATALWPDIAGIFFPEPYVIDFEWQPGVPEAAVRARNIVGDAYREPAEAPSEGGTPPIPAGAAHEIEEEKTYIDLEPDDLEPVEELSADDAVFEEDFEETIPDLELIEELEELITESGEHIVTSGPDSIQPLDDADLEEIVGETPTDLRAVDADAGAPAPSTSPPPRSVPPLAPSDPQVVVKGVILSAPPLPMDASAIISVTQELTRPMRAVREESVDTAPDARVRPLERIRPLRRVQGPRPTHQQPNLIAAALGADPSTNGAVGLDKGRPWYEVIFDDSYFLSLPKNLHRQTRRESRFVQRSLRLEDGASLLDLACGFGRHAIELAKRGYRVTGLDLSQKLIEKARGEAERRNMSIDFKVGDMRELTYEAEFDGAMTLGYSFGFFDDQTNFEVLRSVRQALRPKGRFLLQLLNRDRLIRELPEVIWWRGQDCLILEEIELDPETSRMCSKRNIVFDDGRPPWEQFIEIRLYSLHEIYTLVEDAGFRVVDISGSLHYPGLFFPIQSRDLFVLAERERDYI